MRDFVSQINGTSIYAERASADVSGNAFETTYARASSLSSYALSSDVSGCISAVSANSATWGQGGVDSATVSSIASSYAESAASGKLDSTAQVVSALTTGDAGGGVQQVNSINGMELSAFNSYWATAAGRADYAGSSTTAYSDDNGRELTSLAQESSISSIASSYAGSAASGKLDTTAQVVTATAGDGTYITSINGMGISGEGGQVVTATVNTATARTMYSASAYSAWTGFTGIGGKRIILNTGTVVKNDSMRMQLGGNNTIPYPSSTDGDTNYRWSTGNILLMSGGQGYGYYKGHQLWLCRGSGATSHRISFDVNNTAADVMVYQSGHSATVTPTGFSIWGPTSATADRRNIDSAAYDRWNGYSAKQDALTFNYSGSNITGINGSAVGGGGGGGSLTPYTAVYGSTDYDDIWNAWHQGRLVYVQASNPGDPCYFPLTMIDTENDIATFGGIGGGGGTIYYFINEQGSWSQGTK